MMRRQARLFVVVGSLLVVSLVSADGQPQGSESDPLLPEVIEVQLEKEHLHILDGPIAKLVKDRENFIASDGRYLGIASMGSKPFAKVYILRDGRIDSKLTLQPPPSADLSLFGFAFADGGEICILQGLVKHFVYKKQAYMSTFSFVSRAADVRDHDLLWSVQPRIQRDTTEDPD